MAAQPPAPRATSRRAAFANYRPRLFGAAAAEPFGHDIGHAVEPSTSGPPRLLRCDRPAACHTCCRTLSSNANVPSGRMQTWTGAAAANWTSTHSSSQPRSSLRSDHLPKRVRRLTAATRSPIAESQYVISSLEVAIRTYFSHVSSCPDANLQWRKYK